MLLILNFSTLTFITNARTTMPFARLHSQMEYPSNTPLRQKLYHTCYAPMYIEWWTLPLFKSIKPVPKSSKTIARSQLKCASCEICSYHLGLESPDLFPPFKDMYIFDVCIRTYHWQCLLKISCCNATEREAIDGNDSWACPACINLNQNKKESRIYFQKRDIVEVSWNPTWEPEELQNTCESFKQSLNKFEEHIF